MRFYQFHFLDGRGRVPAMDFTECDDDARAVQKAVSALRSHASCKAVEVFDGDRMVAALGAPEAGPPSGHADI